MDTNKFAQAFNKWMDNYIEHPEEFAREFQDVVSHLEEKSTGKPLTYGERAAAYFVSLFPDEPVVG